MTPEHQRLQEGRNTENLWKKWGPYLSERQWGTVREDYSEGGDAWNYFPHDHGRSRAYHWGEDGLAGFSDDQQRLCFALALWNGKDSIIKERAFGLINTESNHGEDVKEYYFYLDNTPTHSYMKYLYKYPQNAFPYEDLVKESARRKRIDYEYELLDTGVFEKNKYFDVFVEYAKASPEDFLIQISIHNRGPEAAELHVLPTLWFRNWWSWNGITDRPVVKFVSSQPEMKHVEAIDSILGSWNFYCKGSPDLLFTENETNSRRLYDIPNRTPYVKDAFNSYLVHGQKDAINPAMTGTKVSACYKVLLEPLQSMVVQLRLCKNKVAPFERDFEETFTARRMEADAFYKAIIPSSLKTDQALVMRQALAGMLWSKQYYFYDVDKWLEERGSDPFQRSRKLQPRNDHWHHMFNGDVISMPDKWEYPWYAAWDLAFHVLPLTLVDVDFAKSQLKLMLRERYMHPNGQMPAYEWNFSDVNPPVHAWSTIFTYRLEKATRGQGDTEWLKSCFQKLLMNFTWWVNRKDRNGRNVFEGGFLGLDNIGVFDRSAPLPTGGYLEQADGTAWMALYCQNMLEISAELALNDPEYAEMALKFCEHFMWIATAMGHLGDGDTGMWDEEDGFYYDVLRLPDGSASRLKVRSMVGLLPLCAATVFDGKLMTMYPELGERFMQFLKSRQELTTRIHDPTKLGRNNSRLGSILDEKKLRRVLGKMLDENEFLSPYGIRSLSKYHCDHPFVMQVGGRDYQVKYLPAESDSGMFGGNSNWRGPIWMPVNALIIRSLLNYHSYYGNNFKIECPTGSGNWMNLYEIAEEISRRLSSIFLLDQNNHRPVFGGSRKFQEDPLWRDCILFYEYFHGENGAGLGASHQTGWTGVIALLLHLFATLRPEDTQKSKTYFDRHADMMRAHIPTSP
ncbi:MAG: hypothetical protein RL595_2900 [Planctomycetota bacterium]